MSDLEYLPKTSEDDIAIEDLTVVLEICRKFRGLPETVAVLSIQSLHFCVAPTPGLIHVRGFSVSHSAGHSVAPPIANSRPDITPKEFILQKQPHTGVERVACLAYYLTHYRDISHFKTLDISKLNTEAAQPKFANAALSVNDASKTGHNRCQ